MKFDIEKLLHACGQLGVLTIATGLVGFFIEQNVEARFHRRFYSPSGATVVIEI